MSFLPEWSIMVQFAPASLILALIPGPDIMLSVERTITQSKTAGIVCAFGSATGFAIQVIAVTIGLSALIMTSPNAFFILKIVGAIYLLWLAFQILRKPLVFSLDQTFQNYQSLISNYCTGIAISLTNPKSMLFNMTFLPQFISANDSMATQKLLILGLSYIPISLPITIFIVFAANKLSLSLKQNPLYARIFNWLVAGIFTSFAVHILIAQAS